MIDAASQNGMNDEQLLRYSRQIMLPQLGIEGQQRLREASVLVVGSGGLGCPVSMYLAASGIGGIIIADDDKVELTNLQRQLAHTMVDLGRLKAESLKASLGAINPECTVDAVAGRIDSEQLARLVPRVSAVLDCTDNFEARFAINRACVTCRVPLVSGAAIRFEGQVMVYDPRQESSPCYQCLYPVTGEVEETCSQNGIIAPLVGIIGSMQALEAIKLITRIGTTLSGRLQILDALGLRWREIKIAVDPKCPICQSIRGDARPEAVADNVVTIS